MGDKIHNQKRNSSEQKLKFIKTVKFGQKIIFLFGKLA